MATAPARSRLRPPLRSSISRRISRKTRIVEEAGGRGLGRPRRQHRQASQEGRAHPHRRARHPAGAQARRAHGPQSGDRRADPDQGLEEGRFPRFQGPEEGMSRLKINLRRSRQDGASRPLACRFVFRASLARGAVRAISSRLWAVSSAGRAPALHAGCRRFESVTAHQSDRHRLDGAVATRMRERVDVCRFRRRAFRDTSGKAGRERQLQFRLAPPRKNP